MSLADWFLQHPDIAREWDIEANTHISPYDIGHSSKKRAGWICEKGHRWSAIINSRTCAGAKCPYCTGKKVKAGVNDLETNRPDLLVRWDYEKNTDVTPKTVSQFSHKKVWWKCERGHSWQARVESVSHAKEGFSGCPYCSNRYLAKGETDLMTLRPDLVKEWCYELNIVTPEQVTAKNSQKVWWKCEKGHTWQESIYSRVTKERANCPYCINYKVWTGYNDLATVRPDLVAEWNYELNGDLKPTEISKNYRKKVWWKCSKGHVWEAMVYARTKKNGTNCPVCARYKK